MHLRKNIIANYLGHGWVALVGLLFTPVYVDKLGIEAYGLIGFYVVLQTCFSLLDLGMTPTVTRETARFSAGSHTPESIGDIVRSLEVIVFAVAVIIAAGLWLASETVARYWLKPGTLTLETVAGALGVISLVVAARFCEGIYRGVLYGFGRQVMYNGLFALLTTIRHAGAAVVVTFVPSITAFFWWQAGLSIITVFVLWLAAYAVLPRPSRQLRFSFAALRGVSGFAGGMSLTTLLALLFTQVDKVILTRLVDLYSYGHYMLAFLLAGIFSMVASPAAAAFFPPLSAAVVAGDEVAERHLFRSGAQIVSMLVAPLVVLCVVLGKEMLLGWTGDIALSRKVAPILGFVAIGAFCNAVLQVPFMLQLAHGWTTLSVRINLLGVVLLGPMVYFGTITYGLVGASAAWALTNVFVLFLASVAMHRRLLNDELARFLCHTLAFPLVASSLVIGLYVLVVPLSAPTRLESIGHVVVSGSLALLASLAAVPTGRRLLKRFVGGLGTAIGRAAI